MVVLGGGAVSYERGTPVGGVAVRGIVELVPPGVHLRGGVWRLVAQLRDHDLRHPRHAVEGGASLLLLILLYCSHA